MNKKKKPELIRRSYSFQVRAGEDEKGSMIEGRPIVYDSMTDMYWWKEVIEKGALDETDLTDVRFLVNHDTSKIPLARSRKNNKSSTMQLFPDDEGMGIKVYLDTENNSEARNLYSAVQREDITGMSFMFSVDDEGWEDLESDMPTRRIKKISSVVEVSAVTFPAYEDTEIYARDKSNLERMRQQLESERQKRAKPLERGTDYETRTLLMMYGGDRRC